MDRLLLISGVLALTACVDVEDRSTDFNYLHAAIVEPSCATIGCHSAATQSSPTSTGIDLSSTQSACTALRDDQGEPTVMQLLRGEYDDLTEPVYHQMPIDRPLPGADIDLIQAWFDAGAACD